MKYLFIIITLLIGFTGKGNSQNPTTSIKASMGFINGPATDKGVSTNIGIEYQPIKYLGIELGFDNWYRYTDESASDTNTGSSLILHGYPLNFKGNTIDVFGGYGYNVNYWRYASGGNGRCFYWAPVYGAGYYYSFNRFDIGLVFKKQLFNGPVSSENSQFLVSFKKHF